MHTVKFRSLLVLNKQEIYQIVHTEVEQTAVTADACF